MSIDGIHVLLFWTEILDGMALFCWFCIGFWKITADF